MRRSHLSLLLIAWILSGCMKNGAPQAPPAGVMQTDPGGAVGYQHGFERSKFIAAANQRALSEFGFVKVVGSEGTFAVNANNGAVIAIPNARSTELQKPVWYTLGPGKHNQQVVEYFVASGIPQDQVGGVHATTSLYTSGGPDRAVAVSPRIAGWQSILQRVVAGVPVVDSVVWARLNGEGKVISEWAYWPPIPARAVHEAEQLRAKLAQEDARTEFLSRLPRGLPLGSVVIRHSSATADGPFEVFASYDVIERRASLDSTETAERREMVFEASIVRHFDVEGKERNLAQERGGSKGGNYPAQKNRPAPTPAG